MGYLFKFILFSTSLFLSTFVCFGGDNNPWIYGTIDEVSYIKNNLNKVETVYSLKIEKYSGLKPEDVINYMNFKAYISGGIWDKIDYPSSIAITKKPGENVFFELQKVNGRFYIVTAKLSPGEEFLSNLRGIDSSANYQLGILVKNRNEKSRRPAQIKKNNQFIGEDFGFFVFSLFLIIFGISLYFVSRNKNYD